MNITKFIKSKVFKKDRFITVEYEDKQLVFANEIFTARKNIEEKDAYARLIEYSFFEKVKQ